MKRKPKSKSRPTHSHVCSVCHFTWVCSDMDWKNRSFDKCGITVAAVLNKEGPYCNVCFHLCFATDYARARGLTTISNKITGILKDLAQ